MKSPLRYQITEYDCGSVSMINCLTYLFEREEIPVELVRIILAYTLDCYDDRGNLSDTESRKQMMLVISKWIYQYAEQRRIPVRCKYIKGVDVNLLKIRSCLLLGGCVNLKTYSHGEHFVTITNMDNEYIYLFDPYYKPKNSYPADGNVQIIDDAPHYFNRRVKLEQFISDKKLEFALGPENLREAQLFFRNDILLQREMA